MSEATRGPLSLVRGEIIQRDAFLFCDLLPDPSDVAAGRPVQ